jgi:hypothetical protein
MPPLLKGVIYMPVYDLYIMQDGWHALETRGKDVHMSAEIRASERTRLHARQQIEVGNRMYELMKESLGLFPEELITTTRMPVTNNYDFTCHGGITAWLLRKIYDVAYEMPPHLSPSSGRAVTAVCVTAEDSRYVREWADQTKVRQMLVPTPAPAYLFTRHIFGQDTEPGYIWVILEGPVGQATGGTRGSLHSVCIPDCYKPYFMQIKVETQPEQEERAG